MYKYVDANVLKETGYHNRIERHKYSSVYACE